MLKPKRNYDLAPVSIKNKEKSFFKSKYILSKKFNRYRAIGKSIIIIFYISNFLSSQYTIFDHYRPFTAQTKSSKNFNLKPGINLFTNQIFYLNTNLPNLENQNGLLTTKGLGSISSIQYFLNGKYIFLFIEPQLVNNKSYQTYIPEKKGPFSVLNDNQNNKKKISNIRNVGLSIKHSNLSASYGNWNQWWGPGIHNSLVLSNNTNGFFHFSLSYKDYLKINDKISYKIKYIISEKLINYRGRGYYFSGAFVTLKINYLEFGISKNIISGGYDELEWDFKNAATVLFTNDKIMYWDTINDYYIRANIPESKIEIYFNFGYPNKDKKTFNGIYAYHSIGSILGIRKIGIFNIKNLEFGIEYSRLLQSTYFNLIPSPNWFSNIRYNYHSYNNQRWSAHSGSDSDDLLVYIGYENNNSRIVAGVNYERHGVTYHFPPEVKVEYKFSYSLKIKDFSFSLDYENEYFEHYGFVDKNINVWKQTFEDGSIQRTSTILFSFSKQLIFK